MTTLATSTSEPLGRLLRRREVEHETGLSRATIYRKMAQGKFPRPLQIDENSVRWPEVRITEWKSNLKPSHPPD